MQSTTRFFRCTLAAASVLAACASSNDTRGVTLPTPVSASTTMPRATGTTADVAMLDAAGRSVRTLRVEGTLAATGQQNISGLPFTSTVAGNDSCRMTIGGPLGITTARVWCSTDSFRLVNYISREVFDGAVEGGAGIKNLPLPIAVSDMFQLMRGMVPGKTSRFTSMETRPDGKLLFSAKVAADGGAEYALVDTARKTLLQYQRKRPEGMLMIDVKFEDHRMVDGAYVAHLVGISVEGKQQTLTLRYTDVGVNAPVTERLSIDAPPGFTRVRN